MHAEVRCKDDREESDRDKDSNHSNAYHLRDGPSEPVQLPVAWLPRALEHALLCGVVARARVALLRW